MQRDHTPIQRCPECGWVTIMMVYEHGLGDDGEPYQAFYRDVIPHPRTQCQEAQRLAREEWPCLF